MYHSFLFNQIRSVVRKYLNEQSQVSHKEIVNTLIQKGFAVSYQDLFKIMGYIAQKDNLIAIKRGVSRIYQKQKKSIIQPKLVECTQISISFA